MFPLNYTASVSLLLFFILVMLFHTALNMALKKRSEFIVLFFKVLHFH